MTETIKGVIFDLDGVLVDTACLHYKAWKKMADKLNIPFSEKDNEKLKGVSRKDSLDIILNHSGRNFSETEKHQLLLDKNNDYLKLVNQLNENDVLGGVVKLIEELKYKGIRISLGSASKNARLILELTGLYHYFDYIVDGNMVVKAKPAPDVFLTGAELLGLSPSECLVFEDAQSGVQAALTAGMKVVGVGEQALLHQATAVVPDLIGFNIEDYIK
ncbi:beta-phosphoglucomutase [Photobacterium sp. SDRW27]|uniref:beta-phosphoglucomutase n=1 Tax=Photobacterium obscurum TaxID=2829490 RepID=UPI00224463DE|nr:beta-phosphoglucomutase [Photobacterium obscurum]MCW8329176.1 beta-phosphoglucomutase [Photobacterium obscurum]